jgi:clan AA aspartic protease (TIGR02281 family)
MMKHKSFSFHQAFKLSLRRFLTMFERTKNQACPESLCYNERKGLNMSVKAFCARGWRVKTGAPTRSILLILVLAGVFLTTLTGPTGADTLFLKDGRVIEGIIKGDDEKVVRLRFEFGHIEFPKDQIERIVRSPVPERNELEQKWDRQRSAVPVLSPGEDTPTGRKTVKASRQKVEHISVNAVLNKKVPVRLLFDTGASYVVLSSKIGRRLGVLREGEKEIIQLQIGDGRKISAHYFALSSINVEGVEAKDVGAAVLLEDEEMISTFDGVLGMSFLNRFNFKVDQQSKKLMFEELGQGGTPVLTGQPSPPTGAPAR